ncbi:hypothetical protein CK203_061032 [Vitis vinifera]|uniref:Uncharacterized protein n=1 Tax=Vitis vinifera TaxID=29760 RepID=A0A438GH01_VITVI|nr:hypothetical protein CK203_061032 [Vitis vinifera]
MFRFRNFASGPSLFQHLWGFLSKSLASLEFRSWSGLVGQVLTASSPTPTHGSSQPAPNVRLVASVTGDNDKNLLVLPAHHRCFPLHRVAGGGSSLAKDDTQVEN